VAEGLREGSVAKVRSGRKKGFRRISENRKWKIEIRVPTLEQQTWLA
jgi:hypothetical protein